MAAMAAAAQTSLCLPRKSFMRGQQLRARPVAAAIAGKRVVRVPTAMAAKVTVLGASGGIGQPLSLLLKMQPLVSELSIYDLFNTLGVAADLSHINTPTQVKGFVGKEQLEESLEGADVVLIPAGVPRKPGMTRDDLFNINAGIVRDLVTASGKVCPKAIIAIISNPVNSTVPIAAEVLKKLGVYDPTKVTGVTTLDIVRANTFVAAAKGLSLNQVDVPVVGGHAGVTILPLLSQAQPKVSFSDSEIAALTERIQNAGTEVVEAKAGTGSATLSMAYAAARFTESIIRGLNGESGIYECAYVESKVVPDLAYFSSRVRFGPNGVEEIQGLGELSEFEKKGLEALKAELKGSIEKGIKFANAEVAVAK
eukprot:jgi/Chlat1/1792/Chrsp134S02108